MSDTVIIEIPLEDLHDSPTNPRTVYGDVDLQELADNIKAVGRVLQPLLVRPRRTALFGDMPDSHVGYEIVFGHRRRRGAERAGFPTVPCMVRAMDDTDVKVAQVSENLQRKDVHPFEEAQGFQVLLDEGKLTAKDLMAQFGKTHTYVYGRLALLQAIPEVRKACIAGEIGAEAALLIARLRVPKLQQKAMSYIEGKYLKLDDGGKKTHKAIRDLLNERFALELKDALFTPNDATLVPAAGGCDVCPKRSGNAPEYADIVEGNPKGRNGYYDGYIKRAGADVCTDPDCFAAKKTAHLAREAKTLERGGHWQVIGGNRARGLVDADGNVKGGYIPIKAVPPEFLGLAASAFGVNLQKVVIQDPRNGQTVEVVKQAELKDAAAKLKLPEPEAPAPKSRGYMHSYNDPAAAAAREKQAKRDAEKLARENERRRALFDQVRAAAAQVPRGLRDMQLIAAACLKTIRDSDDRKVIAEVYQVSEFSELPDRMFAMTGDELGMLMLDCVLVQNVRKSHLHWLTDKPELLVAAAEHYGVDPSTPSTAARAREGGAADAGLVKYRDPMTGSTWSGRGLKPKWLQVALADGKPLADFVVATPSAAAHAGKRPAADAGAKKNRSLRGAGTGAGRAAAGGQEQSDEAGGAGVHDGQAQLELDTEAGQGIDQSVDAGVAGEHVDQVNAAAEVA